MMRITGVRSVLTQVGKDVSRNSREGGEREDPLQSKAASALSSMYIMYLEYDTLCPHTQIASWVWHR